MLFAPNPSYPYLFSMQLSARAGGSVLDKAECRQFAKAHKLVTLLKQEGSVITMSLRSVSKQTKLREQLAEALDGLVSLLQNKGYQNCCQTCRQPVETAGYRVGVGCMTLCSDCFIKLQQSNMLSAQQKQQKKENILGGIVGALLGTLLGVACIVLLSQLGYVAALSGMVMAICTLKGYELLGSKLTAKGIIISAVLMIVMTYVGDRLDWAIIVARELEMDLLSGYQVVPYLLAENVIDTASYFGNLGLVYFFVLLGAVPTVININRNSRISNRICRIGSMAGTVTESSLMQ